MNPGTKTVSSFMRRSSHTQISEEMCLASAKSDYAFDGRGDWDKASRIDRERYCARSKKGLEAALSGHVVGWRTMDSAPRDGTIILGYWIPVLNAAPGSNSFGLTKFVDGNWWDSDDTEQEYRQPDYWQTLNVPAPPVPEMEG